MSMGTSHKHESSGESRVSPQSRKGVMCSQAMQCGQPLEAGGGRNRYSLDLSGEHGPADLIFIQ